ASAVELRAQAVRELRGHGVDALAELAKHFEGTVEAAAILEFVDFVGKFENLIAQRIRHGQKQVGDVLVEFTARLHDEFGGGGRRRGANVGDEIGDGEVGLVADAGDHGNGASGDGAGDCFFVEGPEIFEGAATASQNQNIHDLLAVEIFDGADDFGGRAFAL